MEVYIMDWLNMLLRFSHFVVGIAWIGASFYFNWLENNLNRSKHINTKKKGVESIKGMEGIAGDLWAIHGGGFYYLQKFQSYPEKLPKELHWFKWEAYFTLITGFALLVLIYYYNANTYLLKADATLSATTAILLSLGGLLAGWSVYHMLIRFSLVKNQAVLVFILLLFVGATSFFYQEFFTPRAVFIQVAAMIGTIMVFNVFFVIMPAQRELVHACIKKSQLGEALLLKGYIRSRHNNYFTLPVLFIMLSSHYPMLYLAENSALVIFTIFIVNLLIRHYFNLKGERKSGGKIVLAIATFFIALSFYFLMPESLKKDGSIKIIESDKNAPKISFEQVNTIIHARCLSCHSKTPSDAMFLTAPSGLILESKKQIIDAKNAIYSRTITSDSMPFANKTRMTQDERKVLGAWLRSL